MKGRVGVNGGGGHPSDLLVCFPARAHLTLMPKPICSPSRPTDHSKRQHPRQSRPLFRTSKSARSNQIGLENGSEPTSPKVTCAGQIKVRPKNRTGRPRSDNMISKNWLESVGLKKDVMHFLGALRSSLRFNLHCFGSFPGPVDSSSDEEEEEEEVISSGSHSSTMFSKWFMVLQESQGTTSRGDDNEFEKEEEEAEEEEKEEMPPKNALLLMRCRSAPAKRGEEVAKKLIEKEEGNGDEDERLMLMSYAPDFFKVSTDIAKETWVVGSVDPLARSRSWRR